MVVNLGLSACEMGGDCSVSRGGDSVSFRWNGGVVARRVVLIFCAVLAWALAMPPVLSHEPDGRLHIEYSFTGRRPSTPGAGVLRVIVTAAAPVHGLTLHLVPPQGIGVNRAGASGRAPAKSGVETTLGDLRRSESRAAEYEVLVPEGSGGILSVRLEGTDDDGRPFLEGAGVPCGIPGRSPVLRNGAAEFPAATEGGVAP